MTILSGVGVSAEQDFRTRGSPVRAGSRRAGPGRSPLCAARAGPGSGQAPGPLLCSFVNPGSGEALHQRSHILLGRDDARIVLKWTWPGRGAGSERERARPGPGSFFFNRGMTQAPVISSLIGSNQFLQELPLINVGLLRSHSLGSQRCCLPGNAPLPSLCPAPLCSQRFLFPSAF